MIANLINGNITYARTQAKRYQKRVIYGYLLGIGWTHKRAGLAAHFLKTGEGFQAYCDAK